jgi:hypothetical protein
VVGAPNADVGVNANQGAAYVYRSNAAPRAQGDSYSIDEDVMLSLEAPGVLGNDSDLDGDPLEVVIDSEPAAGSLTLNSDGSFVYIPALNDNGVITFTYHTSDGQANSSVALVSITVTPVNDPPLAVADGYATYLNTPLVVGAPGLLGNDSDVDGDELNALLESEPAHGELVLNAYGSIAFTPETFYEGLDGFTYLVSDGKITASATVTIFIGGYHVFLPVEIHE